MTFFIKLTCNKRKVSEQCQNSLQSLLVFSIMLQKSDFKNAMNSILYERILKQCHGWLQNLIKSIMEVILDWFRTFMYLDFTHNLPQLNSIIYWKTISELFFNVKLIRCIIVFDFNLFLCIWYIVTRKSKILHLENSLNSTKAKIVSKS